MIDISFPKTQILNSFRLGGNHSDKDKLRPIKLQFENETQKWDFVERVNKTKLPGVYAKLDLSKTERDSEYTLREKARQMGTEYPDSVFKIKNSKILY